MSVCFLAGFDKSNMKWNIYHLVSWLDITESRHTLVEWILTWVDVSCCAQYTCFWHALYLVRMVKPSWVLLSSCVRVPTLNVEVIMTALMESATWTALQKMATAQTLWTQRGKSGRIQQLFKLYEIEITTVRSYFQALYSEVWFGSFVERKTHQTLNILIANPSQMTCSTSASVISGEEQFEDYGESEDVEFTPSSPCPEEDTRTNGFSDLGSSLPSRWIVSWVT